ncbi:MAG: hypothetical protein ACI93L_003685 [Cyclobacteriaceae bacterium]|jgi:hypothetical protein
MEKLETKSAIANLQDHSRLWVYQSNRSFDANEREEINNLLATFVSQWAAHGSQLSAAYDLPYDQFIVLAVDERQAMASGCSIDSSVNLIRQIEVKYGLSLLDRSLVAFLDKEALNIIPFNKSKANIENGLIKKDTIIFNNAVASVGEWKTNWKQQASDSWMARFFN